MLKTKVVVTNQLGLHARAAAQLVKLASKFSSNIKVIREENNMFANAKSILSILTLAATKGTELIIEVIGDDEVEASREVEQLFKEGFGEH